MWPQNSGNSDTKLMRRGDVYSFKAMQSAEMKFLRERDDLNFQSRIERYGQYNFKNDASHCIEEDKPVFVRTFDIQHQKARSPLLFQNLDGIAYDTNCTQEQFESSFRFMGFPLDTRRIDQNNPAIGVQISGVKTIAALNIEPIAVGDRVIVGFPPIDRNKREQFFEKHPKLRMKLLVPYYQPLTSKTVVKHFRDKVNAILEKIKPIIVPSKPNGNADDFYNEHEKDDTFVMMHNVALSVISTAVDIGLKLTQPAYQPQHKRRHSLPVSAVDATRLTAAAAFQAFNEPAIRTKPIMDIIPSDVGASTDFHVMTADDEQAYSRSPFPSMFDGSSFLRDDEADLPASHYKNPDYQPNVTAAPLAPAPPPLPTSAQIPSLPSIVPSNGLHPTLLADARAALKGGNVGRKAATAHSESNGLFADLKNVLKKRREGTGDSGTESDEGSDGEWSDEASTRRLVAASHFGGNAPSGDLEKFKTDKRYALFMMYQVFKDDTEITNKIVHMVADVFRSLEQRTIGTALSAADTTTTTHFDIKISC